MQDFLEFQTFMEKRMVPRRGIELPQLPFDYQLAELKQPNGTIVIHNGG